MGDIYFYPFYPSQTERSMMGGGGGGGLEFIFLDCPWNLTASSSQTQAQE